MLLRSTRSVLRAVLSGVMLAACGGMPEEVGLAPAEETLGTQEAALDCSGVSVNMLTVNGMSLWDGVLSGGGRWSVVYPANGVKLSFYVDGVWRGDQTLRGDSKDSTYVMSPASTSYTFYCVPGTYF